MKPHKTQDPYVYTERAGGSIPSPPTIFKTIFEDKRSNTQNSSQDFCYFWRGYYLVSRT